MSNSILPLFVAIPLGTAFLVPIFARIWKRSPDVLGNVATFTLLIMSLSVIGAGPAQYVMGNWLPPLGINLVLDGLSILFLVAVCSVSFAATLFSISYMEDYTSRSKYYTLFMLMVAGMNGVVLTGDMFNLYVFLEIGAISSYALVGFGAEHEELEASFKYLVLGCVASTFVLLGIGILYSATGTLNMAHIADIGTKTELGRPVLFVGVLFFMGFGLKAAMVPFHAWLPDAHPSAPAPISAMLSGVLIKALGVYALIRVFYVVLGITLTFSRVFIALGVLSMVVGVFLAVGQWDFKRLLAYHSISQMGYVMLGIGIGTPLGIIGGLFHLLNHAAFKSLLFLCSGAIERSTGTRDLRQMGGLLKRMPLTGTACSIASLSISGVPPFNGFWSKLIIIIAAVKAGYYVLAGITVFVSFMTLVSFIKVQKYSLFGKLPDRLSNIKDAPLSMTLSMALLVAFCVFSGVLYPILKPALLEPAREVVLNAADYIHLVLPGG